VLAEKQWTIIIVAWTIDDLTIFYPYTARSKPIRMDNLIPHGNKIDDKRKDLPCFDGLPNYRIDIIS
jgi:hypothetical protein